VFSAWSVQNGYKEGCNCEEESRVSSASLPGYELGSRGIELSRVFGIGSCRIMARKEEDCMLQFEVTVRLINPLPGYD
jgi:hypothetical protein